MHECREFASFFWVRSLSELRIVEIHSFRIFTYMLWYIDLYLVYYFLFMNFECLEFASIFVAVMSLSELRILETHGLPHFSPTRFDILNWRYVLLFYNVQIIFECLGFALNFADPSLVILSKKVFWSIEIICSFCVTSVFSFVSCLLLYLI